jgi:hypothetical protein
MQSIHLHLRLRGSAASAEFGPLPVNSALHDWAFLSTKAINVSVIL